MAKIKFDIPQMVNTRVVIYDILGKEINTPLNKKLKPGEYEIDFDSVGLAAGTYYYKIIIDGHSETKKINIVNK